MKTAWSANAPAVEEFPRLKSRQRRANSKQLQVKTILVPLDFSRASIETLKYATTLASEFGADIHLAHVRSDDELAAIPQAATLMIECRDVLELMQERAGDLPRDRAVHFRIENCHVLCGKPFREICKLADAISADLIVLSTRGNSRLKHIVLGSTAERVVRYAKCPVYIPRGKKFGLAVLDTKSAKFSVRNILVPVDFSECSLASMNYAAALAHRFGATLCLFHAVFPYDNLVIADRLSGSILATVERIKADAVERMCWLRKRVSLRGLECESEWVSGIRSIRSWRRPPAPNSILLCRRHMAAPVSNMRLSAALPNTSSVIPNVR